MQVTWFADSPDAGSPDCLCSFCLTPIDEDDAPVLRALDQATGLEIRACHGCEGAFFNFTANPTPPPARIH